MLNKPFLLIKGSKGSLSCGYLDINTAEMLDESICIVSGVNNFDDMMSSEVIKLTTSAKKLGIYKGMLGSEVISLIK